MGNAHLFLSRKNSFQARGPIIKNSQVEDNSMIEPVEFNEIDDMVPEVQLIKSGGKIEAIKFKCKCGCQTMVKIEYDT